MASEQVFVLLHKALNGIGLQEVLPDSKNKAAYDEAFRRHEEISSGLFEGKGLAYV